MFWNIVGVLLLIVLSLYLAKRYFPFVFCHCTGRLDGKLVVVTGGNSGIGLSTALEIAKRGAWVVLACRDVSKAEEASDYITQSTGNENICVIPLDLARFSSIHKFVKKIALKYEETGVQIYALVNNAGIFYHPPQTTVDGFDITFQTNYLGPALLTFLLLPYLTQSIQARIVFLSSQAHFLPKSLEASTLSSPTFDGSRFLHYGISKLCLTMFAYKLSKVLTQRSNVKFLAADPGNVETNIFRHFPFLSNNFLFALQKPLRYFLVKKPIEGAQTILHLLLAPEVHSGAFYSDCKVKEASSLLNSKSLVDDLWEKTLQWCNLGTEHLKNQQTSFQDSGKVKKWLSKEKKKKNRN